jgi:hypothetical protein
VGTYLVSGPVQITTDIVTSSNEIRMLKFAKWLGVETVRKRSTTNFIRNWICCALGVCICLPLTTIQFWLLKLNNQNPIKFFSLLIFCMLKTKTSGLCDILLTCHVYLDFSMWYSCNQVSLHFSKIRPCKEGWFVPLSVHVNLTNKCTQLKISARSNTGFRLIHRKISSL